MEILKLVIIILDSKQTQQANFKTFALELMSASRRFQVGMSKKSWAKNFDTKLHLSTEAKPI
jgi:hypothetical protein